MVCGALVKYGSHGSAVKEEEEKRKVWELLGLTVRLWCTTELNWLHCALFTDICQYSSGRLLENPAAARGVAVRIDLHCPSLRYIWLHFGPHSVSDELPNYPLPYATSVAVRLNEFTFTSWTLVTAQWWNTLLGFETVEPSVHNWNWKLGSKTCTEGVCVVCKCVFCFLFFYFFEKFLGWLLF